MRSAEQWLAAMFPFVRDHLLPAPGSVLEIGCGPQGGFVPALIESGYDALGVDPAAPDGPAYERSRFEDLARAQVFDAVVACTSLHHVNDVDDVVARIDGVLAPTGVVVVVEWAWERFDEPTAQWCFDRLAIDPPHDERTWLHRHREGWLESGLGWDEYLRGWTKGHGLHRANAILEALNRRFDCRYSADAPYFFNELVSTTPADEEAAIDGGLIRSTGVHFVGSKRHGNAASDSGAR